MKNENKKTITKKLFLILMLIVLIVATGSYGLSVLSEKYKRQVISYEGKVMQNINYTNRKPYDKLEDYIDRYLKEKGIDKSKLGIYIYNFETQESYTLNPDKEFIAASTYKLPLAMYYYEQESLGEISLDGTIASQGKDYEPGGRAYSLAVGTHVQISQLLKWSIQDSDNTASKMLFNNIGGWVEYKTKISKYTTHDVSANYYTRSNIQTAQFLGDCINYIYNNQDIYQTLLNDMKVAQPYNYLNYRVNNVTAQKYGLYEYARNSAGIVLEGSPYGIVVLTQLGSYGENVMGDINRICHEYFNADKKWELKITW